MGRVLFTADEVADSLAVSTSLVRQLTLAGEIPCRRIGRLIRYAVQDVAAYVESRDEAHYSNLAAPGRSARRV
jgi:excisionase family DNA binding protein